MKHKTGHGGSFQTGLYLTKKSEKGLLKVYLVGYADADIIGRVVCLV
jgi:hypothetical protein